MRARKSALSSQSGNLLFMFAMGFNLLWSCRGFVVMVSNRESEKKGKRMTEKQRIEKTAGEKAPMFVIWEFFDDVCYYQATELTFDHSHCTLSTFFRWCVFFTFWQKPSLFSVLSFVYVQFYIYIKLENMAYAFATNQNSTFKIQAELNWFRFVCVIWCVAEQNDGFEW